MNIGDEKRAEATKNPDKLVTWNGSVKGGGTWTFALTFTPDVKGWVFSAALFPRGRSSTEADWAYLGRIAACVRVPQGRHPVGDTLQHHPEAAHKFCWTDDPSTDVKFVETHELIQQAINDGKFNQIIQELAQEQQGREITISEVAKRLENRARR